MSFSLRCAVKGRQLLNNDSPLIFVWMSTFFSSAEIAACVSTQTHFPKYRLSEINFNWEVLCKNTYFCHDDVCDSVMCLLWGYICSDFVLFNVIIWQS